MRRHELIDEQWDLIKDLLPSGQRRGRPCKDPRIIVNGVFWILKTGAPWRDLPWHYGPWQTVYHRFNQWSRDGTWDRVTEKLQLQLDAEGRIDWSLWCVDGSSVRAHRSAAGASKKGP